MASRSASPGGALLRASRVFSMPPPLPRPAGDMTANGSFNSDSATLPHPIHMSITTPQLSLLKGDWGLKRSLPLRSTTKSSTPIIRVEKMDTFEHITEYGSAADHTLSLRKWHEMGVPLTTPRPKKQSNFDYDQGGSNQSVFEDEIDFTADANDTTNPDARWKFKGPWLAGQTQGEFNDYVQKEVRRRKNDFIGFLKEQCSKALAKEYLQQRASTAEAEELKLAPTASDVTDEQLSDYVKSLRRDRTELYKQIRRFLDLPPSPTPDINVKEVQAQLSFIGNLSSEPVPVQRESDIAISMSPYRESGPPKTHPSAGLAYSRTANTLSNHPLFGPQNSKPPVEARIVMPRGAAGGVFEVELGVGGFVTDTPVGDPAFSRNASSQTAKQRATRPLVPGLLSIELDKKGGSKVYVQPTSATIDPKGRVILKVGSAEEDAVLIKEGKADLIQEKPPPKESLGPGGVTRSLNLGRDMGGSSGAAQYGMSRELGRELS